MAAIFPRDPNNLPTDHRCHHRHTGIPLGLFGIAVGLLGILLLSSSLQGRGGTCMDQCSILDAVLLGILGTILFAVVLLAVGIVATSVASAILVGLLLFSFSLALTALACYVRCVLNCVE